MPKQEVTKSNKNKPAKDAEPVEPATNVAPFMQVVNQLRELGANMLSNFDKLNTEVKELRARIDEYDKFFGDQTVSKPQIDIPYPKVAITPATEPAPDKKLVPKHIQDAFK